MRLFSRRICLWIVPFLVSSCARVEGPARASKSPTVSMTMDTSTPDKALKSYWAVRDMIRDKRHELAVENLARYQALDSAMDAVADGALREEFAAKANPPETFSRDIIDLKVESESRAVAVARIKNTTPVPAGAEMNSYAEAKRRDGERYKYVLEKSQAGWRVAEIWEEKTTDPVPDWNKRSPGAGKPSVRSFTFNGT